MLLGKLHDTGCSLNSPVFRRYECIYTGAALLLPLTVSFFSSCQDQFVGDESFPRLHAVLFALSAAAQSIARKQGGGPALLVRQVILPVIADSADQPPQARSTGSSSS